MRCETSGERNGLGGLKVWIGITVLLSALVVLVFAFCMPTPFVPSAFGGGWEQREDKDPVDLLPSAMKDEMRERTKAWEGVLQ